MYNETVWCELKNLTGQRTLIGACYRSPSASHDMNIALYELITRACNMYDSVIIAGDFNHANINWETLNCDGEAVPFLDMVLNNYLVQNVHAPTRGSNILDLVLTSEVGLVNNVHIGAPVGSSDHCTIGFDLVIDTLRTIWKDEHYDYRNSNFKAMKKECGKVKWRDLFNNKSLEEKMRLLDIEHSRWLQMYTPRKKTRDDKQRHNWCNNHKIKQLRKNKIRWWKRYTEERNPLFYGRYKQSMDNLRREIRKAKKNFEAKIANKVKTDPKPFYRYVRSKMRAKESIGPLRGLDGTLTSDKDKMATILNDYLVTVFTDEDVTALPEVEVHYDGAILNDIDITEEVVLQKLKSLKPDKAPGPDSYYPIILNQLAAELAVPLTLIYKDSFDSGSVPEEWRKANVTPIFKKGSKCMPENYRPVSLTSHASKVFESIIKDKLQDHLQTGALIKNSQHGFMPSRSCLTNLLSFL